MTPTNEMIEAGARLLAEWLGYSWEGLPDKDISGEWRDWTQDGRKLQGGNPALRKIAAKILSLSNTTASVEQPLQIGIYGKAFDEPGKRRAYTYEHQPDNGPAYAIGCALHEAKHAPAGDEIDVGLALLKSLGKRGFGVFEMAPKGVAP